MPYIISEKTGSNDSHEKICRWRRRRLVLSKIPECLQTKIVTVRFASTEEELRQAFHLVYQRYYAVGLIPKNKEEIYYTPYQLYPDSRIAIAKSLKNKKVTSTATLVLDSEHGLPSDRIYKKEIDALRKSNKRLAEYTCLAALPDIYARNGLLYILRLLGKYAVNKGITGIVASVHPKHADFYEKILLFERKGELKYYEGLKDAPAYLEFLDLTTYKSRLWKAYSDFPEGLLFYNFFFKRKFKEDEQELLKNIIFQKFTSFYCK